MKEQGQHEFPSLLRYVAPRPTFTSQIFLLSLVRSSTPSAIARLRLRFPLL
jgi:hypothetical protein